MGVREKLVELIFASLCRHIHKSCKLPENIADDLIADGVTVQEFGEWEEIEDDWNTETIYKCSVCKGEFVTIDGTPADNLWNYCPHCGAKMMPHPLKGE